MRWKEYLEYEKNRDVNVNKIYNKLGMDINTVTQNSEAQLYTPNKDSSKDVSMWLTRKNNDEEAERVRKLQEISDRNKANIDKVFNGNNNRKSTKKIESLFGYIEENVNPEYRSYGQKKMSNELQTMASKGTLPENSLIPSGFTKRSSNNTSLSPLENDSATKNKKKKKSFLSDFVGGVLDVGNNLLLAEHNLNKSTKEAMLNSDIDMMKAMGLTDEEIAAKMKKMTGVDNVGSGADVVNAKNERLAKNKADIYDKYSTVSDDDSAISKIGKNIAYSAPQMLTYAIPGAGQVLGTVNSYGDGYGNAKNKGLDDSQANLYGLREGAFDLAVVPSLLKGKSTLGKSIANAATKGTAEGVVRQGSEYLFKDEDGNSIGAKTPGEFAKNVAMQGAMSTLIGAGAHGANKAIGKASDVISRNVDTRFNNMFDEMDGFVKTVDTDGVGLKTPFSRAESTKITANNGSGLKTPLEVENKTLSLDQGLKLPFNVSKKVDSKNNINLSDEVAATAGPNTNASKFANDTVLNSNQADDILKEAIEDQGISYERLTNKETLENARKIVNENPKKARNIISNGNKIDAETMAIGQELILKYQQEGRYDEAIDLLEDISERGTKAGQAIQALSMWKRLTPEGMLTYAQRKVNKYNSEVGSNKAIKLSEDNAKTIVETMEAVNKMEEGRAKDVELAKVNQYINDLIPSSFEDKIDSFRYINMLFNPKTMIKNVGGNVINTGMGSIRDTIGSGIDKLIANKTGIRTTGLPNFGAMGEGFKKGFRETVEDYKNGVDTSMELKDGARGNALRDIPLLGKAEKLTGFGLKLGDTPFYEAKSNEFLQNYMKLNGIDDISKLPAEVLEEANRVGLEATYQQRTGLGDEVNNLKNSKFTPFRLLTKSILPFSQTPSAILDTSLNYTPIGAVRGVKNISKALNGDNAADILSKQRKGVNQLASGILGTGIMAGGYAGAQSGALTGSLSDDKDMYNLQKQSGMQPYSLRVGDTYNSLEFAQPAASPLMIGADIAQGNLNPLETAVNSVTDNSYLSGLKNAGEAFADDGAMGLVKQSAKNYASQLLPFGTLANQINKTLDPTVKDTYSSNEIEREVKKAMSKYPGLSQMLPQGVDTVGEGKVYNEGQGLGTSIFNNFLNPSTMSYYNPSNVEANALDMYYETGDTVQAPSYHSGSVTNKGKTYNLTDEEMREYSARIARALQYAEKTPKGYAEAMQKEGDKFRKEIIEKYKFK